MKPSPDLSSPALTPKTRNIPFLIVVGLFGLGLGFLINILDPFIYAEKVRLLAPPWLKNTALSFITIMSLVVALVTQPLVGRWSDRTRSRWGRRAPYLASGVLGMTLSLVLVAATDNFWLLIIAAMTMAAFSNTMQGPWQALIPDHVPEAQRGKAAGIKTLLELMGVVSGVAVVGVSLSRGHLWTAPLMAMGLFWGILLVTLYTLSKWTHGQINTSTAQHRAKEPNNVPLLASPHRVYQVIRGVPGFAWWMLNRFLFWSAAIAVRTFMLNYLEDVLLFSPAEAQLLSSRFFLILGFGIFGLALPAGAIADRTGRHPLLLLAGGMAAGGATLLLFARELDLLFVAGGLIAIGAGIFASSSWALATDLVPKTEGALYLGLANGATVIGSMGGRLGGPLIDGINQLTGTATLGYLIVFGIAALFFLGSSVVALQIPQKEL
ncbi:MAG: MFS transporter [Anaerolineae bacterium]|nr:MFS transporter [Anaerolineae bacterium]